MMTGLVVVDAREDLIAALMECGLSFELHASVDDARARSQGSTVAILDGPLAGSGAAIERLRTAGMVVIAVVEAADSVAAVRATTSGASEVVFRPLRASELGMRVQMAVQRSEPRLETRSRAYPDDLRRLIHQAGVAVWLVDSAYRTLYANAQLAALLGHTEPAVLSVAADELVHDFHRGAFREVCARARSGEGARLEVPLLHADGTEVWVSLHASSVALGPDEDLGVVVVAADITESRRAENAARRGKARYRALVEASPDCILILNADGTIELSHQCSAPEVSIGNSLFACMTPEHRSRTEQLVERALATDVVETDELDVLVAGAPSRHIVRLRRIDEGFGPDRLVAFLTNVSELNRVRAELQASQVRLVQGQRMEAVGRLAGGLAHDFNNLLSVIGGCASFIGTKLRSDHESVSDLQRILDATSRAEALTRQLLAFSKRQHLRPCSIELAAVVHGMERTLLRVLGEHILLRVTIEASTPRVFVDPGQMEQVLLNLATNARDWMPNGGILTIAVSQREVVDALEEGLGVSAGRFATLSVSDTGGGLTPEEIGCVFEPFFGRDAPSEQGLVLASVYGIVQQSRGAIHVQSVRGRGTTFTVLLPEHLEENMPPSSAPRVRDQRILVVEDDSEVRYVIVRALAAAGFVTIEAAGPEQALALLEELDRPPDLLVTDVVMPGMSGAQLARCLEPRFPGMRVLYVTGYLDDTTLRHGLAHQSEGVLLKPVVPGVLVRRATELLEGRS